MQIYKAAAADQLPPVVITALAQARNNNQQIILATGVFDVLHQEHLTFLRNAKKLGGMLIVGVESDIRVRLIKGSNRPVNNEEQRVRQLQKLGIVDIVFILPEKFDSTPEHAALMRSIRPDVLAVSSHTAHLHKKQELVTDVGGVVKVVHQYNPSVSTTQLLGQAN